MNPFKFIFPLLCLISFTAVESVGLHYINEPIVSMRELPTTASKVVSQAVFSETIELLDQADGWSFITTPDGYRGWVPTSSFIERSEPYDSNWIINCLASHIYHVKDTEYGPVKTLPYGSKIELLDSSDNRWLKIRLPDGQECYIQKGDVSEAQMYHTLAELVQFSKRFLGLPYTWGGRSSFGYDCSGFVQMLYRHIGINLPRDSKDQVHDQRLQPIDIEQVAPGDLLFFGKSEHRIMHVAMAINNSRFIHVSVRENQPWLRISQLNDFEWSGDPAAYYPYRTARTPSFN
jgi:hypothetical protein